MCLVIGIVWLAPSPTPPNAYHFGMGSNQHADFVKGSVKLPSSTIKVDIALSAATWQKGMMDRKAWGEIQGMLFVFPDESVRSFWMKNTYLPLDIVFINAGGRIVHIAEHAKPMSEDNISSNLPAQYALEIEAGKANAYGLKPGDMVEWSIQ